MDSYKVPVSELMKQSGLRKWKEVRLLRNLKYKNEINA